MSMYNIMVQDTGQDYMNGIIAGVDIYFLTDLSAPDQTTLDNEEIHIKK